MSNADKVKEYIRRHYETDEGTVEANVANLFAEDLVYCLGAKTVGREGMRMETDYTLSSILRGSWRRHFQLESIRLRMPSGQPELIPTPPSVLATNSIHLLSRS